jgi:hypothetical protein
MTEVKKFITGFIYAESFGFPGNQKRELLLSSSLLVTYSTAQQGLKRVSVVSLVEKVVWVTNTEVLTSMVTPKRTAWEMARLHTFYRFMSLREMEKLCRGWDCSDRQHIDSHFPLRNHKLSMLPSC